MATATILILFGTRPEVIKLAPVIAALEAHPLARTVNVASGQHAELLYPFIRTFGIRVDHDLHIMEDGQTPSRVCARVLATLEPLLARERPDLVVVQGDTTTATAGALAAFHERISVAHVEAGLRSGDPCSPFPEEMNRRLITRLATYHFAATSYNRRTLLAEGVTQNAILVTGNPVVDSLQWIRRHCPVSAEMQRRLEALKSYRLLVLTTHRRENVGAAMTGNLQVLRRFVERSNDVALACPVHPNPAVRAEVEAVLAGHPRIVLLEALDYADFIGLLSAAWLIVSDSGGVQEEAPTLGKPLLILRANTERPEAVASGIARLVGGRPEALEAMLAEADRKDSWIHDVFRIDNPFGRGDSGRRIARAIERLLGFADVTPRAA